MLEGELRVTLQQLDSSSHVTVNSQCVMTALSSTKGRHYRSQAIIEGVKQIRKAAHLLLHTALLLTKETQ